MLMNAAVKAKYSFTQYKAKHSFMSATPKSVSKDCLLGETANKLSRKLLTPYIFSCTRLKLSQKKNKRKLNWTRNAFIKKNKV